MQVEYNNKTMKFEELDVGEVFIMTNSSTPMMKTEMKGNRDNIINAVSLTNGFFECVKNDDEVIPKKAKLTIDN